MRRVAWGIGGVAVIAIASLIIIRVPKRRQSITTDNNSATKEAPSKEPSHSIFDDPCGASGAGDQPQPAPPVDTRQVIELRQVELADRTVKTLTERIRKGIDESIKDREKKRDTEQKATAERERSQIRIGGWALFFTILTIVIGANQQRVDELINSETVQRAAASQFVADVKETWPIKGAVEWWDEFQDTEGAHNTKNYFYSPEPSVQLGPVLAGGSQEKYVDCPSGYVYRPTSAPFSDLHLICVPRSTEDLWVKLGRLSGESHQ